MTADWTWEDREWTLYHSEESPLTRRYLQYATNKTLVSRIYKELWGFSKTTNNRLLEDAQLCPLPSIFSTAVSLILSLQNDTQPPHLHGHPWPHASMAWCVLADLLPSPLGLCSSRPQLLWRSSAQIWLSKPKNNPQSLIASEPQGEKWPLQNRSTIALLPSPFTWQQSTWLSRSDQALGIQLSKADSLYP